MQEWRAGVQNALRATEANLMRATHNGGLSNDAAAGAASGGVSGKNHQQADHASLAGAAGLLRQLGESMNALRAQTRSHAAELDLERTVREDSVKELSRRMGHEMAEMREIVKQLRNDNADLRKAVFDLERRPAARSTAHTGIIESPAAESGTASHYQSSHSALLPRVADLEAAVSRHQTAIADRARRHDALIQDMINAKIDHEVEKIRSIAREAARDSTEDLVKLRIQSIQSMFAAEIERAAGTYQQAAEMASGVEQVMKEDHAERSRQFAAVNQRISQAMEGREKWNNLQAEVRDVVRAQLDTERTRLEDVASVLRGELASMTKRQASEAAELQHSLQHYVTQRLDVLSAQTASREDVQRLLQNANAALETELVMMKKSLQSARSLLDETRQEMNKFVGNVDGQVADARRSVDELAHARTLDLQTLQRLQVENEEVRSKARAAVTRVEEVAVTLQEQQATLSSNAQATRHAQDDYKRQMLGLADADAAMIRRLEQSAEDVLKKASQQAQTAVDAVAAQVAELAKNNTTLEAAATQRQVQLSQSISEVRASVQARIREVVCEEISDVKTMIHEQRSQLVESEHAARGLQLRFQDLKDSLARELEEDRSAFKDSHKQLATAVNEKIAAMRRTFSEELVAPAVAEVSKEVAVLRERLGKVSASCLDVPHLETRLDDVAAQAKDAAGKLDDMNHKVRILLDRSALETSNLIKSRLDAHREEVQLVISRGDQAVEDRVVSQIPAIVRKISEETVASTRQRSFASEAEQSLVADAQEKLAQDFQRSRAEVSKVAAVANRLQSEQDARYDEWTSTARELQTRLNELDGRVTTVLVQTRSGSSSSSSGSLSQLELAVRSLREDCADLQKRQTISEKLLASRGSISSPSRNDSTEAVALTVDEVHNSVSVLIDQKLEPLQDAMEDIRITVEEAVAGLRENIADISTTLEDCALRVVQALRDLSGDAGIADANEITSLADVFSILMSRSKATDETVVALSENMLGTVDLVQRHEAGFASIRELAEAIAFNAQNIVTLAAAVGLDKNAFTLKLNYDSFGDSTDEQTHFTQQNTTTGGGSDT